MWTSSSVVEFRLCILWSLVQSPGGRSWYTLLMRPNKIETVVRWFRKSHTVLAGFSGNGYSIYNIIPLLKNKKEEMCIKFIFSHQCLSFSGMESGFCIYHLVVWSNFVYTIPCRSPFPASHNYYYYFYYCYYFQSSKKNRIGCFSLISTYSKMFIFTPAYGNISAHTYLHTDIQMHTCVQLNPQFYLPPLVSILNTFLMLNALLLLLLLLMQRKLLIAHSPSSTAYHHRALPTCSQ